MRTDLETIRKAHAFSALADEMRRLMGSVKELPEAPKKLMGQLLGWIKTQYDEEAAEGAKAPDADDKGVAPPESLGSDYYGPTGSKKKSDEGISKSEVPVETPEGDNEIPRGIKKEVAKDGSINYEIFVPIAKVHEDEQLVAGVVYEPDVVDAQGDSADSEEIRKAAHDFMLNSMRIGLMHKDDISKDARIVESFIAPSDMSIGNQRVRKGSWVMIVKIFDKDIWKEVKEGRLTGFSMSGYAVNSEAA